MSNTFDFIILPNLHVTKNKVVVPVELAVNFHYNDEYASPIAKTKDLHEYVVNGECGHMRFRSEKELDAGMVLSRIIHEIAKDNRIYREGEDAANQKVSMLRREVETLKARICDLNDEITKLLK